LTALPRLHAPVFGWLVPGLRRDLVTATIRTLPKPLRVALVPAPDTAAEVDQWMDDHLASWHDTAHAGDAAPGFHEAFAQAVQAVRGVVVPPEAFDDTRLPGHLRITFQVVSAAGAVVAEGKDLVALQRRLSDQAQAAVSAAVRTALQVAMDEARTSDGRLPGRPVRSKPGRPGPAQTAPSDEPSHHRPHQGPRLAGTTTADPDGARPGGAPPADLERTGLTSWPRLAGPLPREVCTPEGVHAYPSLVEEPDGTVSIRTLADPRTVPPAYRAGLRRLLVADVGLPTARVTTRWAGTQALALATSPYPSTEALVTDVQLAAVDALLPDDPTTIRDIDTYAALRAAVRQHLEDEVHTLVGVLVDVLTAHRGLDTALRATTSLALVATAQDIRDQQQHLVYNGFVATTGPTHLPHLPRYLRAATHRLDRAERDPHRDQALAAQVRQVTDEITTTRTALTADPIRAAALTDLLWQVEELRVSLFAQHLGTPTPVSVPRLHKALAKI
jgi:ATP-dependent helicase HrpA